MMNKEFGFAAIALMLASAWPSMAAADVKVGFLGTLSGPSAAVGQDQLDGFNLAVEQLTGKLGGVKATVLVEDDQQKPEVAQNSLSKLLEREKVDVVIGLTFANILMSLQPKIANTDVPFVGTVAGPSPTAGAQCKPNLFITSWQSDVPAEAVGKYMNDKGFKRISTLTPNFVGGKDKIAGLKRAYKGEVVNEIYTPLSQLDFSAELTQVNASKPEAVFIFYPGALAVSFVRQYKQAGLSEKYPLYSANSIEGASADAMGDAAVGAVAGDTWTPGMDNAQSRQFVAAFKAKYKRSPSAYAAFSYDAAVMLNAAIASLNGNVSDHRALSKAIKNARFDSVRGTFRFGNNNYPVQSYHIFRIAKDAAGHIAYEMIAPDVLKDYADPYAKQCTMS